MSTVPDHRASHVDEAYRVCQRLARAHYENFPVASWLVPRTMRPHVAAVYAFARVADDLADEGDRPAAERLRQLADWRRRLDRQSPIQQGHAAAGQIFTALHETIARFDLDLQLFHDLISAFEQDVTVTRYATWHDVLDYCRRSANPVGRLVLALAGQRDAGALARSDAVCTALQLANFWQDFSRDRAAGRMYVPMDVLEAHGAREQDADAGRLTDEWREVFADVIARTDALFAAGRDVTDDVRGRLRYELRATWLGGTTILRRTAALRARARADRPVLGLADAARIARGVLRWRPQASGRTVRS
jgi:hydroxysqualene synthase